MSDIQSEVNNRLIRCIERETGIDLANIEDISKLSLEEKALIQENGFKCALKSIRRIGRDKFRAWAIAEYEKIVASLEEVGNRLIRFNSKIQDPVNVFTELNLMTGVLGNLVNDIDDNDLFSDTKSVLRLLFIISFEDMKKRVFINSMAPQRFTMNLAQNALGKDDSWSTSVLALTIEEQFVKKKAVEFGIDIKKREYYSILEKLTKYLDERNIRQNRELLLADSHRKIRNKVLHENWNPTEDEMDDIISHVLKIIQFFSSEEFL